MHQNHILWSYKQIQKLKYLYLFKSWWWWRGGGYRNSVCMHFYLYAHDISILERCVELIEVFVSRSILIVDYI